ncbi:hypothetical protein ACFVYD_32005 [Streptomyces sp. NPDC058301]|uniref:hypothetical protein n=1 Tax=Streptomyces sp. NPDC058301 TaxID=3346436 RepID=UPI0036E682AD
MRAEVHRFVAEGPLPDGDASEEEIDHRVGQLAAIAGPVTAEEATALTACFGPDDCYGVAWNLLHLIETGPNPVLTTVPTPDANDWHHILWTRAANAGLVPADVASEQGEVVDVHPGRPSWQGWSRPGAGALRRRRGLMTVRI